MEMPGPNFCSRRTLRCHGSFNARFSACSSKDLTVFVRAFFKMRTAVFFNVTFKLSLSAIPITFKRSAHSFILNTVAKVPDAIRFNQDFLFFALLFKMFPSTFDSF